jgi:hypothetical protein
MTKSSNSRATLPFQRTAIGLFLLASASSSFPCFGGENSCPDMSAHEQVLEQGKKMLMDERPLEHEPRRRSWNGIEGGALSTPQRLQYGKSGYTAGSYTSSKQNNASTAPDTSDSILWSIAPDKAADLPLGTLEQVLIASRCAEYLMERNEFRAAHKLYTRILAECTKVQNIHIATTAKAGSRISQMLAEQESSSESRTQSDS